MLNPLDFLTQAYRRKQACALITIVEIHGSSPRRIGAQMAVRADGTAAGSLSGGCLDAAVVAEAKLALAKQQSHRLRFGEDSPYIDISLPCGSGLTLQFDATLTAETVEKISRSRASRIPFSLHWSADNAPAVFHGFASGHKAGITLDYLPDLRLVTAGNGANLLSFCKIAQAADIKIEAYCTDSATREALDTMAIETRLVHKDNSLQLDAYTAALTLFHEHEYELAFLKNALGQKTLFVGAMGSPRAHAARVQALQDIGVDAAALARLRGPVGLLQRTRTPAELAVSIIAEIMQCYRQVHFPDLHEHD